MEDKGKTVEDKEIHRQLATAGISDELWAKARVHKLNPFNILDAVKLHGLIVGDILAVVLKDTPPPPPPLDH